MIHLYFNLIGVAIFLVLYYLMQMWLPIALTDMTVGMVEISAIHTLFNLMTTLILLPVSKGLVRLAEKTIHKEENERGKRPSGELKEDVLILDGKAFRGSYYAIDEQKKQVGIWQRSAKERLVRPSARFLIFTRRNQKRFMVWRNGQMSMKIVLGLTWFD